MNARVGVEGEVDSHRESWKERVGGKVGGERGCSTAEVGSSGSGNCAEVQQRCSNHP